MEKGKLSLKQQPDKRAKNSPNPPIGLQSSKKKTRNQRRASVSPSQIMFTCSFYCIIHIILELDIN